jgi:hypothetical protein
LIKEIMGGKGGELLLYTALLVAKVVENEVLLSGRLLHKDGSIRSGGDLIKDRN